MRLGYWLDPEFAKPHTCCLECVSQIDHSKQLPKNDFT